VAREIDLFVGKNYLVTVHDGTLPAVPETADRWCENVERQGNRGIGLLVYSLLDSIVDGYFPVVDDLADRIEDLEAGVFAEGGSSRDEQAAIFALKKDLLAIRRVLGPERDVMNVLVRRDAPVFGGEEVVYFQDVYDHILRVTDAIDTYRDLLSSALDAHLSMTSYHLNEVVKRLTSSSIILMSMTLIAGIYGMNFAHMPELDWRLGYAWALGLMVAVGSALLALFRRIDWLCRRWENGWGGRRNDVRWQTRRDGPGAPPPTLLPATRPRDHPRRPRSFRVYRGIRALWRVRAPPIPRAP